MKELTRVKMRPINVVPGDSISLIANGKTVAKENINKEMLLNEAVVFEVEKGWGGENTKQGIGGVFLEVD